MKRGLVALVLLGGTGLGALMADAAHQQEQQILKSQLALQNRRAGWESLKRDLWREIRQFHGRPAVLVEDLQTGWKAGYQQTRLFPAASVVKIAILAACFEAAQQGRIDLSQRVTLRGADKVMGSGLIKAMPNGTELTVEQLLELMITRSDNTATNLLIRLVGFDELNRSFREMGLEKTRLSRKMMDFKKRRAGVENYTTAEEMALMLRKLYRGQVVSPGVSGRCLEMLKRQGIRDRISAYLPPDTAVANKTGLERGVCHDLGIVFAPSGDFLICVLTEHNGKTSHSAKRFIARLAERTYRYRMDR